MATSKKSFYSACLKSLNSTASEDLLPKILKAPFFLLKYKVVSVISIVNLQGHVT